MVGRWCRGLGGVGVAVAIAACQDMPLGQLDQLVAPSYESQLADHLTSTGAKMYGAYWCPHCARQKDLFGNAATQLPYVECDARGVNAQVDLCKSISIEAYPTWQIAGKFYLGAQPVNRLAQLSGFADGRGDDDGVPGDWGGFSPAP